MYMCIIFMILNRLLVYIMSNALHMQLFNSHICVDVRHRAATFICGFWTPPRVGEVLPKFFVDRLLLIFRG
jgi:hypothetical protein